METRQIVFLIIVIVVIVFLLFRILVWDKIKRRQNKKQSDLDKGDNEEG